MITKIKLMQGVIGYEYAAIAVFRGTSYRTYQYTSSNWNRAHRAMKTCNFQRTIIRPDGATYEREVTMLNVFSDFVPEPVPTVDAFSQLTDEIHAYDYLYEINIWYLNGYRWEARIRRSYHEQWPSKVGYGVTKDPEESYLAACDAICQDIDRPTTF